MYYEVQDVVIIVYDVSRRSTFESVEQWLDDFREEEGHTMNRKVYELLNQASEKASQRVANKCEFKKPRD